MRKKRMSRFDFNCIFHCLNNDCNNFMFRIVIIVSRKNFSISSIWFRENRNFANWSIHRRNCKIKIIHFIIICNQIFHFKRFLNFFRVSRNSFNSIFDDFCKFAKFFDSIFFQIDFQLYIHKIDNIVLFSQNIFFSIVFFKFYDFFCQLTRFIFFCIVVICSLTTFCIVTIFSIVRVILSTIENSLKSKFSNITENLSSINNFAKFVWFEISVLLIFDQK